MDYEMLFHKLHERVSWLLAPLNLDADFPQMQNTMAL
jgi:hypothetical protein